MATEATDRNGLRPSDAAAYLGLSVFTLRNMRAKDRRAIARGEPMRGPRFINLGTTLCIYRKSDLDVWLEQRARATAKALQSKQSRA